ncbi:laccase-2 [Corynascus novoguineensis]|uniref:Laccase-2 n=1 Tax=Corynascus novoguineensis TaxID=1126955 RepID=A0AAN7CKM7_9PEZI|nr:laccase-2 [Corynascus novoguineensis]
MGQDYVVASLFSLFTIFAGLGGSLALSIPRDPESSLQPRQEACENTPTSRHYWGEFNTDTNYYAVTPDTGGPPKEFWLSVVEGPYAPDSYNRTCMTFNGTIPGPTIIADWGDEVIIYVTNNMASNGTSIHWHGLRMLDNTLNDGVPGTMTYRFRATYLQYAKGLFGGMILRGPTTADYDEDLGYVARLGAPPIMYNGLINGTNSFDYSNEDDAKYVGGGKKFEVVFEPGKKYLLRLVNVTVDGVFQFSIDGHNLQVVAYDLVPIVLYTIDSVQVAIGQRYDVINRNAGDITGIVRYDAGSTADPETESGVELSTSCLGESPEKTVLYLSFDVTNFGGGVIFKGKSLFLTEYNVVPVEAILVIQDISNLRLTYPIYLHGHDFWVLAAETGLFDGDTTRFNTANPSRRDTATLPGNGYLAIAFRLDNPGAWLVHCHIAWHASQGLALEFVESQEAIQSDDGSVRVFNDTCASWLEWTSIWEREDSGI